VGTPALDPALIAVLGPIGVLLLAGWFLWLRYGQTPTRLPGWLGSQLEAIQHGVTGVLDELKKLNGRLAKMEEWRIGHDKQDDERHERDQEAHAEFGRAIERLRDHQHDTELRRRSDA
jgi:hypothetical protein